MTAPREWPDGWVPRSVFVAPPFRIHDLFPMAFTRLGEPEKPPPPRRPEFLGDLLVRPLPDEPETPPTVTTDLSRNAICITLSAEHLADYGPRKAGPETREEWEARQAEERQEADELAEAWRLYEAAMERIPALIDRVGGFKVGAAARAVWDLHAPVGDTYPTCKGCDPGSYAEDDPAWPCSTVEAIAKAMGVPLPANYALRKPQEDA